MRSDQRKANKLLGQITEENYVVIGALTDLIGSKLVFISYPSFI